MRPSQYNTDTLAVMTKILTTGITANCLTDKDAFQKMNELLAPEGEHICYRTYQRYKAAALAYGEQTAEEREQCDPMFRQLHLAIERSQLEQKEKLFAALLEAPGNEWHKYRWILERKFADFNLRKVTEKFLHEQKIEQSILEQDLAEMGFPMAASTRQTTKPPTRNIAEPTAGQGESPTRQINEPIPLTEKPGSQVAFEVQARQEVEEHVPAEELPAFKEYWAHVQQQWDKKNPIYTGYVFNEEVRRRLTWHYQVEYTLWEKDKQKWMNKLAA